MSTKSANSTAVKSFNANHSNYDVFRPSFTPVLVNPFLVHLGLATKNPDDTFTFDTTKHILEIAAGTGKFTRNLVDNGWTDNLAVLEPSKGMLETFNKNFPQIKNQILGSSYKIPLEDNSIDAVIIAQGFHWFADLDSLKEIYRVLKPQGKLGLIWNFDYASPSQDSSVADSEYFNASTQYYNTLNFNLDTNEKVFEQYFDNQQWNKAATKFIYGFDVNVPQYRHGKWRQVLKDNPYFSSEEINLFALYDLTVAKDDAWKYWETRSYITEKSDDEKQRIKKDFNELVEKNLDDSSYSDKDKQLIIKPMATHAVVLQKKSS